MTDTWSIAQSWAVGPVSFSDPATCAGPPQTTGPPRRTRGAGYVFPSVCATRAFLLSAPATRAYLLLSDTAGLIQMRPCCTLTRRSTRDRALPALLADATGFAFSSTFPKSPPGPPQRLRSGASAPLPNRYCKVLAPARCAGLRWALLCFAVERGAQPGPARPSSAKPPRSLSRAPGRTAHNVLSAPR